MRFLVDAQLPPALARMLAAAGHQAEHVEDVGLREADDPAIWEFASQHGAVIVTKDEDFAARLANSAHAPPVIWLRIGNCSKRALLAWLQPLLPHILQLIQQGDRLVEVR